MEPMKQPVARILLGFGVVVFLGTAAAWGQTYSRARIVRLSFVEGNVTVQRPDLADWAEAPMNTPVQEGFKLSTGEGSFAEVEFENGSTVRLGQLSLLEFTELALAPDGSKIDHLTLRNGYATFHAFPEGQDVYEVLTSNASLTPCGRAMFRIDTDSSEERVEVFHGSVEAASSLGSWTLAKNAVLDLSPEADQPFQLSEGIKPDDWDRWVQEREGQEAAANNGVLPNAYTNNGSDNFYGWSDLSYYGDWSYMPGYGYGWMPNVYAGWSPYSLGRWCWYPGFGYTWISGDPWGWLPYHYGGWEFIPGIGWVWFPGSFGAWSPGLVAWYGGPGWIGWMPLPAFPNRSNTNPCSQGQPCGIAVSTNTFRGSHPVGPATILAVNPASGRRMEKPDIPPDRQATLPGPVVAQPAGFSNTKLIMIGRRNTALSSQAKNTPPTPSAPGAVADSSRALGASAFASVARFAAPGPQSGIVYDPAAGRYVNDSRPSSEAMSVPNELSIHSLPSAPGASASFAPQPAPGNSGGRAPAQHSHATGSFRHSSRSGSSSAPAPSAQAKSSSGSSAGHSMGGAASSGGGTGGGGHAGGGSGSGGGHR